MFAEYVKKSKRSNFMIKSLTGKWNRRFLCVDLENFQMYYSKNPRTTIRTKIKFEVFFALIFKENFEDQTRLRLLYQRLCHRYLLQRRNYALRFSKQIDSNSIFDDDGPNIPPF